MKPFLKNIRLITLVTSIGCYLVCACAPLQPLKTPPAHTKSDTTYAGVEDSRKILDLLYQQVEAWEGTPYRLGGLSKKGIDCSGFVYTTYLTRFNTRLPRNTHQQSKVGDSVFKKDLRAGDLIFFRIGYSTRHVGIYLENNLFAHASKSRGVMISRLQDTYWSKRYWKAIRIKIDML